MIAKSLVVDSTTKLSKQDWKMEQQADSDIGPIITLINNNNKSSIWNESFVEVSERLNDERGVTLCKSLVERTHSTNSAICAA